MKLSTNSIVKFLAAVLAILTLTAACISSVLVALVYNYGGYREGVTLTEFSGKLYEGQMYRDISDVADYYVLTTDEADWAQAKAEEYRQRFDSKNTNFRFTVTDYETGNVLLKNDEPLRGQEDSFYQISHQYYLVLTDASPYRDDAFIYYYDSYIDRIAEDWSVTEYQQEDLPVAHVVITGYVTFSGADYPQDAYANTRLMAQLLFSCRSAFWAVWAVSIAVTLLLMVFLCYAAGRRSGPDRIALRVADRIPLDLYLLLHAGGWTLLVCLFFLGFEHTLYSALSLRYFVIWTLLLGCASVLAVTMLLSLAARVKVKGWWKNTLIVKGVALLFKGLISLLRRSWRWFKQLVTSLPLVWKTLVVGLVFAVAELISLQFFRYERALLPLFLLNLAAALLVFSIALQIRALQDGCRALAEGQDGHRVDTTKMFGDFRRQGEDINRIGEGISHAVEAKLKSERMRTQLITNVSHDLKTPLTSIINYVDLLDKLELPQEAADYVEVLRRQSDRLKKLTEDLMEASNASTGNLTVELAAVDLNELVEQVVAEYAARFATQSLTGVTHMPDEAVMALGDGRYLWRVMDNLLGNVCKYAMPHTRVYIDTFVQDGFAHITVKNISREWLNISADELMERFVRGDASRNTEGSGLGLSIAQSLAKLMGGSLTLTVDGDLFKADVSLPIA